MKNDWFNTSVEYPTEIGFIWEDSFESKFYSSFQLLDDDVVVEITFEDDLPLSSSGILIK